MYVKETRAKEKNSSMKHSIQVQYIKIYVLYFFEDGFPSSFLLSLLKNALFFLSLCSLNCLKCQHCWMLFNLNRKLPYRCHGDIDKQEV